MRLGERHALDVLDGPSRADSLRAHVGAVRLGSTFVTRWQRSGEPLCEQPIAAVRQERIGARQRGGACVIGMMMHHCAARNAAAAGDAVSGDANLFSFWRIWRDLRRLDRLLFGLEERKRLAE